MVESNGPVDYSEAIARGVSNWLDKNQLDILAIVRESVMTSISNSTEKAIDTLAGGAMLSIGRFLDNNRDDLITGIAAAMAAKQYPSSRNKN